MPTGPCSARTAATRPGSASARPAPRPDAGTSSCQSTPTTAGWGGRTGSPAASAAPQDPEPFRYTFNDLDSVRSAVEQADPDQVAAVFVSPFRHDAGHDQE